MAIVHKFPSRRGGFKILGYLFLSSTKPSTIVMNESWSQRKMVLFQCKIMVNICLYSLCVINFSAFDLNGVKQIYFFNFYLKTEKHTLRARKQAQYTQLGNPISPTDWTKNSLSEDVFNYSEVEKGSSYWWTMSFTSRWNSFIEEEEINNSNNQFILRLQLFWTLFISCIYH